MVAVSDPVEQMAKLRDEATVNRTLWQSHLQTNASGEGFKGNLFNVMKALELAPDLAGIAAFDDFARRLIIDRPPPWDPHTKSRAWTNNDDVQLQRWLQGQRVPIQSVSTVAEAVRTAARRFDPLRDYLDALRWDGTKRISTFLPRYFGADETPYTRAVGQKWSLSAVARAYEPGCQADHTLALEGAQGTGKTSSMRIMGAPWHKDGLSALDSKDAIVELQGVWIVELSELAAMSRTETEAVKSFLTRTVDKYREPYGRHAVEQPRRCVFVATTNEERWLKDTTGNRRFWPVRVGRIDLNTLARDRDQLWAEAVRMYRAGAKWHLTEDAVIRAAEAEQLARVEDDPWTPLLKHHLDALKPITTRELLNTVGIDNERLAGGHAKRVGGIMRRWGWSSHVDKSKNSRDVIWTPNNDRRASSSLSTKGARKRGK